MAGWTNEWIEEREKHCLWVQGMKLMHLHNRPGMKLREQKSDTYHLKFENSLFSEQGEDIFTLFANIVIYNFCLPTWLSYCREVPNNSSNHIVILQETAPLKAKDHRAQLGFYICIVVFFLLGTIVSIIILWIVILSI